MRLLVAGSTFRTKVLYRWLRRANSGAVAYFPDGQKAVAALKKKVERFDYALLEEGVEEPEGREIVRRLRTVNSRIGIAYLAPSAPEERLNTTAVPKLVGFFERSKKGKKLLSCQLSETRTAGNGAKRPFPETITYEYRADCPRKKAGNE